MYIFICIYSRGLKIWHHPILDLLSTQSKLSHHLKNSRKILYKNTPASH
jgi:hypothetical protein